MKTLLPFLLGVATLTARTADAQTTGLALDRFDPAPAGDRMFGVPSPYAAGNLVPHVQLLGDYAHNPLVLLSPNNSKDGVVVQSQLYLNLDGGIALWDRLFFDVDIPLAVYQAGNSPAVGAETFSSPGSAQFGDLRLGGRGVLYGTYDDPFQVALGGYLWLPTASSHSFVGTGSVRALPQAILGGRILERIVWSAALGPEFQAATTYGGGKQGAMFHWGAGVGVLLLSQRQLQVGPEASGDLTFTEVSQHTTNAELLFDAKYRFLHDFEAGAGVGPGLTSGIGTPDVRAILSIAYTPEHKAPVQDRDHDGILDPVDACPDVPGLASEDPSKNGCPLPPDRDHDGIIDSQDACPDVPGVPSDDPAKNGCPPPPPDRDHDGIIDSQDACPDVPGVPSDDPAKNGCPPPPPDRDHDGIIDSEDACPDEKGPRDPDPKRNGCPRVHVSEKEVVILEQVQFDTGKATIKPVSFDLLDQVADVLKSHPELTKLEVQGHTDSRGSKAANQTLSQARAASVMKALLSRGVTADRLSAKGYGQDRPIAPNTTEAGRALNRRVQFAIVARAPK
jgi:outer membrane protein OmpA-like peptidoglycan-associated protein